MYLVGGRTAALLGSIVVLWSCTPVQPQTPTAVASAAELATLQKRIDAIEQQQRTMKGEVVALRAQRQLEESQYKSAEFDPAEPGFQRIDANYGSFAVSLGDVRQFADSVKVRLDIGNLSSATFTGVKLILRYGPRPPEFGATHWSERYNAWQTGLKSREQTLVESIRPANWNPVQIVLPGIEEKQFGYLEVKIETTVIQLL